jgi:hypothetical protein
VRRASVLLLVVAATGCRNGTFVDVTLDASAPLTVASLAVTATNNGMTAHLTIRHGTSFTLPPAESFALKLDDARRGDIVVDVSALDDAGQLLAAASDHTTIVPGGVARLSLDLSPGVVAPPPDIGDSSDLAAPDLMPSNPALASFAVTTPATTAAEHDSVSIHLVARDASAGTLLGYTGTPTLSGTWGDLRVVTPPVFTSGEADATVAFNRETSASSGLAHVKCADGSATGISPGVAVTVPPWSAPGSAFYQANPTGWDKDFDSQNAGWVREPAQGHYFLVYSGYIPGPAAYHSIGLGTSDDGTTLWASHGQQLTTGADTWEGGSLTVDGVVWDGQKLVLMYRSRAFNPAKDGHGFAVSPDGTTWTRSSATNPVLGGVTAPCDKINTAVIAVAAAGSYRILFNNSTYDKFCTTVVTIDGDGHTIHWSASNVVTASGLPSGWTPQAFVKEGSVYKLYATDSSPAAHYATSGNGVDWIVSPTDPLNSTATVPAGMFWNPTTAKYEGLFASSATAFVRITRP